MYEIVWPRRSSAWGCSLFSESREVTRVLPTWYSIPEMMSDALNIFNDLRFSMNATIIQIHWILQEITLLNRVNIYYKLHKFPIIEHSKHIKITHIVQMLCNMGRDLHFSSPHFPSTTDLLWISNTNAYRLLIISVEDILFRLHALFFIFI